MKRTITSIFIILIAGLSAVAKDLGLIEAIRIAQDSAITAYQSQNALLRSEWEYKRFLANRRTQLSFVLNPGYQKFTNEPNLHYYKLRNYNMLNTFGEFRLEQQANNIGGNFYASTGLIWTEYFGEDAAGRVFSPVPIGVGYSNNLIGYNPHKWEKAINDFHLESEQKAYNYQLSLIAEKTEQYFIACLVAEQTLEVCEANSRVTKTALEIGQEKFAIAAITKNELFALELQHVNAENSVFDAKQVWNNCRTTLFSYLQIEDNGQKLSMPEKPEYKFLNLDELIALAKDNNPRYRDSKEKILRAKQTVAKTNIEASHLQTALDLSLGIQGNANNFVQSYSGQKFWAVGGITLKIPIFDSGLAKSKKKVAEYNLKYAESESEELTRQLELEIAVALKDFNNQQDLLMRTLKAISLANESLEIAKELYENGAINIDTFSLALDRKDNSYKNYLSSLQKYWDSWYALKRLCVVLEN